MASNSDNDIIILNEIQYWMDEIKEILTQSIWFLVGNFKTGFTLWQQYNRIFFDSVLKLRCFMALFKYLHSILFYNLYLHFRLTFFSSTCVCTAAILPLGLINIQHQSKAKHFKLVVSFKCIIKILILVAWLERQTGGK